MSSPSDTPAAPSHEDRVAGSLLGLALGDALGFVVEAEAPEVAEAYVRESLRADRAGERAHREHPFGQYSDDTQLARTLLLAVADAGEWSPDAFAARLAALFREGRDVGAGEGSRGAARRLLGGAGWQDAGAAAPYPGNGSAMRVAPLGVLFGEHPEILRAIASQQSLVTHRDPRCVGASVAIAGAAALATRSGPVERSAFLDTLAWWVEPESSAMADVIRDLGSWAHLPPEAAARRLHASRLDPSAAGEWRGISSHVLPSVAWSLYAFLRTPDDYWSVVCTAIAVGGDTDSMAAMAGGIAGGRVGFGGLPGSLLARLTDRGDWGAGELEALARRCSAIIGPSGA